MGGHEDFIDVPTEPIWTKLQTRKGGKTEAEAPWGHFGHIACTTSKAAGRIYGSAKQEKLVIKKT